ncbi:MAG: DUF1343 domain-containing protein [Bacteroidetes bacterium]|nr:MAG: DUF1343 domain-containing protein [Bacteroidota bacterium]
MNHNCMKNYYLLLASIVCILWFPSHARSQHIEQVSIGANELFRRHSIVLQNKRVGVICNKSSLLVDGRHLIDKLLDRSVHITAIFSPEHGFRSNVPAGENVQQTVDPQLGIPIYSLYGKYTKPTKEMLQDVDALIFDLPDVGARFYTFASTMALAMEAAQENKKRFIVLDRPNPLNGVEAEGPVLDTSFSSFVGMFPMPIRHGLTIGEIARMIAFSWRDMSTLDLVIIPMHSWKREYWLNEISVHWSSPSPNIKMFETTVVYPGTCLFEGTNVSEGRGTDHPFQYIGAPWIDEKQFASKLNGENLPGVTFNPIRFTPQADSVAASNPKFKGVECRGVFVNVSDKKLFKPVATAVRMLELLQSMYPDRLKFLEKTFDRLAGVASLRTTIQSGKRVDWKVYQGAIDEFMKRREEFLIY